MSPTQFVGEWFVLSAFAPDASCLRLNYTSCGAGCLAVRSRRQLSMLASIGVSSLYRTAGRLEYDADRPERMAATFTDSECLCR